MVGVGAAGSGDEFAGDTTQGLEVSEVGLGCMDMSDSGGVTRGKPYTDATRVS